MMTTAAGDENRQAQPCLPETSSEAVKAIAGPTAPVGIGADDDEVVELDATSRTCLGELQQQQQPAGGGLEDNYEASLSSSFSSFAASEESGDGGTAEVDADLAMIRALIAAEESSLEADADERLREVAAAQERILQSSERWKEKDQAARAGILARQQSKLEGQEQKDGEGEGEVEVEEKDGTAAAGGEGADNEKEDKEEAAPSRPAPAAGNKGGGRRRFFWSRSASSSGSATAANAPPAAATPAAATPEAEDDGLSEKEAVALVGTPTEDELAAHVLRAVSAESLDSAICADLTFWSRACLRARRFRVDRSAQLLTAYSEVLRSLSADQFDLAPLARDLLESGVICFLGQATDRGGRGLLLINMRRHDPRRWGGKVFLHALHAVVASAIKEHPVLQVLGFRVLLDMTGSVYANFDSKLPKLLGESLNNKLPLRYSDVVLVNPPMFFAAAFRVASVFINGKMRERLQKVKVDIKAIKAAKALPSSSSSRSDPVNALARIILPAHLPAQLGGEHELGENFAEVCAEAIAHLGPCTGAKGELL